MMQGTSDTRKIPTSRLRLPWKAASLLADFNETTLRLQPEERAQNQDMFWRSICSEHDARHFYRHLINAGPALPWSFQDFLAGWLADEVNHARGFKIVYRSIYGVSFEEIERELQDRSIDFSRIEEFFQDLQSACLLFAYDELVTTRVYQLSIPFYDGLQTQVGSEWIRRLVYDEAQHFRAVMKVLFEHCSGTSQHAEKTLCRIIEIDLSQPEYRGTFVLDHVCPEFPFGKRDLEALVQRCIVAPLRNFHRRK